MCGEFLAVVPERPSGQLSFQHYKFQVTHLESWELLVLRRSSPRHRKGLDRRSEVRETVCAFGISGTVQPTTLSREM